MFEGTDDDLRQTKVTQPAIFLHSVILAKTLGSDFQPDMTAGHSLGEFSALVAAGALSFEDGLKLVYARAMAMQKACEAEPSTMAAILGLDDAKVEEVLAGKRQPKTCPVNCIRTCDINTAPYCIIASLTSALRGNFRRGYAFAGSNVWRTNKIIPVKELMETIKQEYNMYVAKYELVSC